MTSKGNPGTPEVYPSSVELPPLLLWLELLLEPLYPVESWYSSIAFFVPSLDEETYIFWQY